MRIPRWVHVALIMAVLWLPGVAVGQEPIKCEESHSVVVGDRLTALAVEYYGDRAYYRAIVDATNSQTGGSYPTITDPNVIQIGWTLCVPSADDAATLMSESSDDATQVPTGLSLEDLGNASYLGIYDQPAVLTNGKYEGEPFVEGGASRPTVTLIPNPVGYGDITGDGQTDAVVLLAENSGGSGTFIYLAVVADRDGRPVNLATASLGDRVQTDSITIEDRRVAVEMLQAGPDDPMCCPTQHVANTYALEKDELVQVSSRTIESAESLTSDQAAWQWVGFTDAAGKARTIDQPDRYTVEFRADGQVDIKADCNSAKGSYTTDGGDISIMVGPMTLAECEPGSLYDDFVQYLGAASQYRIENGELFLDLAAAGGTMHLGQESSE